VVVAAAAIHQEVHLEAIHLDHLATASLLLEYHTEPLFKSDTIVRFTKN